MIPKIHVSVKAVLANHDTGDILLLRENKGDNSGKFHFPGGHMEEEETVQQALRREVLQETGIEQMEIGDPYYTCRWPAKIGGEVIKVLGIFFPCSTEEQDFGLSEEHDMGLWTPPADYRRLKMVDFSDQIIDRYVALEPVKRLAS